MSSFFLFNIYKKKAFLYSRDMLHSLSMKCWSSDIHQGMPVKLCNWVIKFISESYFFFSYMTCLLFSGLHVSVLIFSFLVRYFWQFHVLHIVSFHGNTPLLLVIKVHGDFIPLEWEDGLCAGGILHCRHGNSQPFDVDGCACLTIWSWAIPMPFWH